MTIVNTTPHAINIFDGKSVNYDAKQRKYFICDGAAPIHIIPPSGMMLNAQMETIPDGDIGGIPLQRSVVSAADQLPDGDDKIIVSRLFHSAMLALGEPTDRLLLIGSPVYRVIDGAIAPCGCLALERG